MTIKEFLDKQIWHEAVTYKDSAPHEYCLKREVVGTPEQFYGAVVYIKNHGFPGYFYGNEANKHEYLYLDGLNYWTMDPDPDKVILINRCNVDNYKLCIYPNLKKKDPQKLEYKQQKLEGLD